MIENQLAVELVGYYGIPFNNPGPEIMQKKGIKNDSIMGYKKQKGS